ncbi:MAG: hypothetical protein KAT46_00100 [Deltaproteobacteria bacterium]|nr:hypothetical protein [Deltaproteobacteria bacterium]
MKPAIGIRNKAWEKNTQIPNWVDIENVGLDQFFTHPDVAKKCWESLNAYMISDGADLSHYKFIEPSAGLGSFYDLLPNTRRIGIDVDSFRKDYVRSDFLSWTPKKNGHVYACVGNPPFGYRAWLALMFLNHAAKFSDYVGFILPMGFQSRGKSNLIDRVKGLHLVHSSILPRDSFIDVDGKSVKINALWQIWAKKTNVKKQQIKTCNQYIDLFTVDMRKERLCGQKRIHEADFFLQRTFYSEPPKLVASFDQVKYVCGYGIVIKHSKRKVLHVLKNADWLHHSNLASHNCRHISMCHIRAVLTENGLIDV